MGMKVTRYDNIISRNTRDIISNRYKRITKAINREFWNIESEIKNSLYVGSYGRNTSISTSDIDILVCLPGVMFDRFNKLTGNGQSKLLQVVRYAIKGIYPNSDIRADGQIVKINFCDGIAFEILPTFKNYDGTYTYADSNMGGNWLSTNPKAEQNAIRERNIISNGLLVSTCRHMRYIRDNYFKSYKLSGIVIDSFVYTAIGGWSFVNSGETTSYSGMYEHDLLNYFSEYHYKILLAPGSNAVIDMGKSVECLEKVLKYMVD